MRIHYIQHVPFEDPGMILDWAEEKKHTLSSTMLFNDEKLPEEDSFDLLVIMGGPMNIYEYEKYPWLKNEKEFLKKAIGNNKKIIGICLGAQLIADVLGADIYKNSNKEIGWFPVKYNDAEITVLHWHGDTFDLPEGADLIFTNNTCTNQGFIYKNNILALQFHLEMKKSNIQTIIQNCGNELDEKGMFIQSKEEILSGSSNIDKTKILLYDLLNNFTK